MHPEIPSTRVTDLPDPLPEGLAVLDVREPGEWAHGHIEGATHIPLHQLPERIDELPDRRTLVVCKVGGRSAQAVAYLSALGRDVLNLEGGMLDWQAAGRPMVGEVDGGPHIV